VRLLLGRLVPFDSSAYVLTITLTPHLLSMEACHVQDKHFLSWHYL
jgi:hypothetical protein